MILPPYKIKVVEKINLIPREEREKRIREVGYNLFFLQSQDIYIDLLTDSGTGAMSDNQWAGIMLGDESYAGSINFKHLEEAVKSIMGFKYVLPTHQGRGAEHVLDEILVKPCQVVPGNMHFDTTKAHIINVRGRAIDCVIEEAYQPDTEHPFKGNIDISKLEGFINKDPENIAYVLITATCNSGGGQPVSLENIRQVHEVTKKNNIALFMDAARFAENAFFIKEREAGYKDKSIQEIVKEMMSHMDGCTMSAKKDAINNIGGFIAINDKKLYDKLAHKTVLFEGFITYGGMSGRDMEALARGLFEGIEEDYLRYRIGQVRYVGEKLSNAGIPIMKPFGGHAVFINGKGFLPHIKQENFPSQTLCIECYIEGGVRGVEVGTILAGRDQNTGKNIYPRLDLMRLAIPRRVYCSEHLDYVCEIVVNAYKRREKIKGFEFDYESPTLRHFLSTFKRLKN
ncbi:MAG: Tyrosine phenol-lyase [Candidatus Scalindua rubra]|uniref:Tyrosine phenol-lyase n=1 Tax=Candidatus Scalindua rubra TaxID=1872076 RepID=A0A1E3XCV7_9BACT|nr:MAG: Tyrosine phenol-lyase [Candidatus Scalindua rubra]